MIVELINTGSELMLGRVLNSHQQWLCRQLADLGYVVTRQTAISDAPSDIEQAVRESLSRAELVITTGGLGPTSDDLTRDAVARLLGKRLYEDAATLSNIENLFARLRRPMPKSTRVQAMVPEGTLILPNSNGTAPGLAMEIASNARGKGTKPRWLIMLPGPPRELRPMFVDQVVPLLKQSLPLSESFLCRTFRTVGLGESSVEEKIQGPMRELIEAGLEIGYCARPGQVDVRFVVRGTSAEKLMVEVERILSAQIGTNIFGRDDEDIESVIVRLLTARKQTLAMAESCTGGCIAHRLTNVSGASAVLVGGFVTYSNEAKQKLLGVRSETLAQHGAVSEPTAREMAEGARRACGTDYAIGVTGIAGPAGGTPDKPVGTAFISLASVKPTEVWKVFNPLDRATFKDITAQQALEHLRQRIR